MGKHNWHAIVGPSGMCECGVRDDGSVVTCGDLLQQEKQSERDAIVVRLASFCKHKPGCASGWRASTGSSQIGPCDCGLDAAIAAAGSK